MHNIEASPPKLARDTCITNGILYDQCVDIAVQKLILMLQASTSKLRNKDPEHTDTRYSKEHALLVHRISRECSVMVHLGQARPLVEELCILGLDISNGTVGVCSSALSPQFVTAVADLLSRDGSALSYESKTAMWKLHYPLFESMLLEMLATVPGPLNSQADMVRACQEDESLFSCAIEFLRVALLTSQNSPVIHQLITNFMALSDKWTESKILQLLAIKKCVLK